MPYWSVYLEALAPEGAGVPHDLFGLASTLMDLLSEHGAVTSAGDRSWSVQLSVTAKSSSDALDRAQELVAKAAVHVGLPDWPFVRVEAVWDELIDAEQSESPLPQLLGSQEVVEALGVSRQRFHELRARKDFPEPVLQLAATPLWLRSAIDAFLEGWDRRPGRRNEATLVRISEDGDVEIMTRSTGESPAQAACGRDAPTHGGPRRAGFGQE
jgi:predicted DNA-binding transcriptional regulator AlpA